MAMEGSRSGSSCHGWVDRSDVKVVGEGGWVGYALLLGLLSTDYRRMTRPAIETGADGGRLGGAEWSVASA